jgi:lipid II:glycine glycyltransferase (peptidoglycan interpeptide bridge formation enzyme)
MQTKTWQIISDKNLWDKELLATAKANFLQSSSFGEFHKELGSKIWRLGFYKNDRVVSFAQVVEIKNKLGDFLYIPWGPILNDQSDLGGLLEKLAEIGEKERSSFVRLEPRVDLENYAEYKLKISPSYIQPQCSLVLDLTKSEEELKSAMSDSTRYNVGWVQRQGVEVELVKDQNKIEQFVNLLKETAGRHSFKLHHNENYYKTQFEVFSKAGSAKLFIAKSSSKEVLSAAIVVTFGETATYLHASSSSKQQKLRAPYLMQWTAILDAKNSGIKKYDFWGVAPTDKPNESWAGVTAFKKSFGGERICYPRPYDLVFNYTYYIQMLVDRMRPLLRRIR